VSNEVTQTPDAAPNAEVKTGLIPAVLSHAADCKCAPCRAFWWELFVVTDERAVMTGDPAEVVR
jgi:hypothetical protein